MNKEITFRNYMIPFSSKEEEIRETIYKTLCDNTIPLDLFKHIYDIHAQRIYFPMVVFNGAYQGSWTCETYHEEEKVVVRRTYDDKRYFDSEVHKVADNATNALCGNFSTITCGVDEKNPIASLLGKLTKSVKSDIIFSANKKEINNPISTDEVFYMETRSDLWEYWHFNGKKLIHEDVLRDAKEQLAQRNYSGLRVAYRHELTNPVIIMYIPIWLFAFSYGNMQYHIIVDDASKKEVSSLPVDEKILEMNRLKKEINNEVILSSFLFGVFAFITLVIMIFCDKNSIGQRMAGLLCCLCLSLALLFGYLKNASKEFRVQLLEQHISKIMSIRLFNGKVWLEQQGVEKMNICKLPSAADIIARDLSTEIYNTEQTAAVTGKQEDAAHKSTGTIELPPLPLCSTPAPFVLPKSRSTYVLLAILMGTLGVHNLYAGYTIRGIIQLLITLLSLGMLFFVSAIWAIVEACCVKQDANGVPFR